ncbi:hypothetical protein IQ259_15140 [Fortiea sp. LEGE XX443]|uniref:hypothetical protein n=1 Tax=Fortiea sp. LEGE XX443 TaxID=1828611 RepID=UPI00187EDBE0|nr:hypothetical protein [Fortiea sp. LEGE XX443]MBE9006358.1 hypothetical protein [Fortiea sp. LEGE XX443]
MVNIKLSQLNWLGAGISLMLMSAVNAPASAQSAIFIERSNPYSVNQPPAVGSFIYGSPIPTPVPVDPSTGLLPSRTIYPNYYPRVRHHRSYDYKSPSRTIYPNYYPRVRHHRFHNSKFGNPVIINNSWRRTPFRGRSRVILNHPRWYR